jgi:hypothetical protein
MTPGIDEHKFGNAWRNFERWTDCINPNPSGGRADQQVPRRTRKTGED